MKNILLLFSLLWLLNLGVKSQSFIEIGNGNDGTSFPISNLNNYAWTSFMYTSDEMGDAKTIDKIAYFGNKNMEGWVKEFANQTIYFSLTSANNVRLGYPDFVLDGYTKVYEGSVTYPADGSEWIIIDVDDFEYDGTSNLIIHYQNRSGVTWSSLNPFNGTKVSNSMGAYSSSDKEFPANTTVYQASSRPNIRVYQPVNPNLPATPTLVSPSNEGIKIAVDHTVEFNLANTEKYDFYIGTSKEAMAKVASDIAVTKDGTFSYAPNVNLKSKTKYYIKIVAYKGSVIEESPIYSFTTQKVIESFPFTCDFEGYYIGQHTGSKISSIIDLYKDQSDWSYDKGWKCGWIKSFPEIIFMGDGSAFVNLTNSGTSSLGTPRINLPKNYKITFVWKKGGTNSDDINTYLEISTDGGANWEELMELPYVNGQGYTAESVNLIGYSGDNVFIRWRHKYSGWAYSDQYFALDDIKISELSNSPEVILSSDKANYSEICVGSQLNQVVSVTNTGLSDLVIRGCNSDGPFSCNFVGSIAAGATKELTIEFDPKSGGKFSDDVIFDCNTPEGSFTIAATGSAYRPLGEFSRNFDNGNLPDRWLTIEIPSDVSSYVQVPASPWENSSNSGDYSIVMNRSSDVSSPMFAICEGVRNFDVNRLVFVAKKSLGILEDLPIDVGVMTNPTDPSTFKVMKSIKLSTEYVQYSVLFSAEETAPYIAFRRNAMNNYSKVYIDDVIWENLSNAKPNAAINAYPVNAKENVNHYMPVKLSWKDSGKAPTGFKLKVASNPEFTDVLVEADLDLSVTSYTIDEELDYNTTYYWQVIPYNVFGDCQTPKLWSFTTMPDPTVKTLPYTEDFESVNYVHNQTCVPLGWCIEDMHTDNKTWNLLVSDNTKPDMVKGSAAMLADYSTANAKDDYLYTPAFTLKHDKKYQFKFMMHTMAHEVSESIYREDIEVLMGQNNSSVSMQVDALVSDYVEDENWKEVVVNVNVDADGDYFFALHAISNVAAYRLIVDNVEVKELVSTDMANVKNEIAIWPNPTSDNINIKMPFTSESTVQVYNQLGSIVYATTISKTETALNLHHLPSGWYCLVIETADNTIKKAFIKK